MTAEDFLWIAPASPNDRDGREEGVLVGALMPGSFAAYARILHPYREEEGDAAIPWSTVAQRVGSTVHPEVQWHTLVTGERWRGASSRRPE